MRGEGLEVGGLEAGRGAEEVVADGEAEAAEVVEEGDPLGGRVEGQRRRVGGELDEDHLGELRPPALWVCVCEREGRRGLYEYELG